MARTKGSDKHSEAQERPELSMAEILTKDLKSSSVKEFLENELYIEEEDIAKFAEKVAKTTEVVRALMPVAALVWKLYRKDAAKILGLFGDVVNDISEDLHEKIVRGYHLNARLKRAKYDALIGADFTPDTAMQILLAEIKPTDYSSLLRSVNVQRK